MTNHHRDHRQRVKKEFRENGMEHFPPHKVLEVLLYGVFARQDTNALAHRLIERFGSLSGVFDAPYELLLEVEGIGVEAATHIKLAAAVAERYFVDKYSSHSSIRNAQEAKDYMRYRFLTDSVECVLLVCLNNTGKVIYASQVARGTLEKVDLLPGDVIKACLRANAAKALLAHNHPGGFCNPSRKDISTTCLLYDELRRVDVRLLDHIIVASDGVFSLQDSGMCPKLAY